MIKARFSLKNLFWISYFILVTTLCADSDNRRIIYFSIFMLFIFSIFLNRKLLKVKVYQATNIWFFFFLIFGVVTLLWSIQKSDSYDMIKALIREFIVIMALGLGINSMKDIYLASEIYMISCAIMMVKLSIYMALGYSGYRMWDEVCGNNFNTVAQILALNIMIAFYFFMQKKQKWKKILYIAFIAFAYYHIYTTGSRKGLVMPIAGIAIFLIIKSGANVKKIIKNSLMLILGAIVLIYFIMQNQELTSRFVMVLELIFKNNAIDESSVLRTAFIELANSMFISSPLIGCGINTFASQCLLKFGRFYYSHNNFFEILSGMGIIGFALYYWFYVYSIYKFYGLRKKNDFYILGISIWITLTIFEYGIVTYSIQLYTILFTVLAVSYRKDVLMEERTGVFRLR